MPHFNISAEALGHKIKDAARRHNLDTAKFASRYAAQRVLDKLDLYLTPFFITGGQTVDPRLRETADADIVALRRVSNREMHTAFKCLVRDVKSEGVEIIALSDTPREIAFTFGNPADRWQITAMAGGIRANFGLDVGWSNGWGSRPIEHIKAREIPSLMNGVPAFRAAMQPQSTSVAQKVLAVLMQPSTDFRVKHLADVVSPHIWSPRPDPRMIALEIHRICFDRGIPMSSVCPQYPESLRWSAMERLEKTWDSDANASRTGLTLFQAWADINALWADVHHELERGIADDSRRSKNMRIRPRLSEVQVPAKRPTTARSVRT
ncbi:hypothetical protein MUO32_26175 [Shinella sp. CPCC 101442]|uniref:nucleotidyl transferase AbiEii/AbiGii toxin family protein n=1 Tax=Shinella sp. CPCC 101442 TaxID=2932265 RepID=UPI0021535FF4|nr:nucleotidyl transferase AbiEii/AbiGii toxin family protein [Shinella sp. CPCC 101442]MCR6502519.1 hypothetical protein [Shinella sp. CPCC 101442]